MHKSEFQIWQDELAGTKADRRYLRGLAIVFGLFAACLLFWVTKL